MILIPNLNKSPIQTFPLDNAIKLVESFILFAFFDDLFVYPLFVLAGLLGGVSAVEVLFCLYG